MGSRLMHLALGKTLADRLDIKDRDAFITGSILPDALPAKEKQAKNSHFITVFDEGRYKWFDSIAFYDRYTDEMRKDPIYLGYYFHLMADNVFRQTFYIDMGLLYRRGEKSLFEEFYNDYNLLNPLITAEYGLQKNICIPGGLYDTRLYRDFMFEPKQLIDDIYSDMDMHIEGELMHFSMDIVRSFVEKSADLCMRELDSLVNGRGHVYDRYEMAIENYYSQKTEG